MSWGDDEEKEILIGCGSKQHRRLGLSLFIKSSINC